MHFLLKFAYEMHVNVFLNSEFMLPFHVLQVTLAPTDLQPPVSRIVPEPQLDSQEGKVIVFFYFNMYFLSNEFEYKISPVVLYGLTYVYYKCLEYLSIGGLHFLIHETS